MHLPIMAIVPAVMLLVKYYNNCYMVVEGYLLCLFLRKYDIVLLFLLLQRTQNKYRVLYSLRELVNASHLSHVTSKNLFVSVRILSCFVPYKKKTRYGQNTRDWNEIHAFLKLMEWLKNAKQDFVGSKYAMILLTYIN